VGGAVGTRESGRARAWLLAVGGAVALVGGLLLVLALRDDPASRLWIELPARPFDQATAVDVSCPPWLVLAADEDAAVVQRPSQEFAVRVRRGLGALPDGFDDFACEEAQYVATGAQRTEGGKLVREYVFDTYGAAGAATAIQARRRKRVDARLAEIEPLPPPARVPADGPPRVVAKDDALGVLVVRATGPMPALHRSVSFRRPAGGWVMGWVAATGATTYAVAAFPGHVWDDVSVGDEAVFRD
jgi:hypothetical protein